VVSKRPWTPDDVAKLRSLARKIPTAQIARELNRGLSATVMKAHSLRISLRLKPKRGSRQLDLRHDPTSGFADISTTEDVGA
jgi:hypothetical protein